MLIGGRSFITISAACAEPMPMAIPMNVVKNSFRIVVLRIYVNARRWPSRGLPIQLHQPSHRRWLMARHQPAARRRIASIAAALLIASLVRLLVFVLLEVPLLAVIAIAYLIIIAFAHALLVC